MSSNQPQQVVVVGDGSDNKWRARLIGAAVVGVVLAIFIFSNFDEVEIQFLFVEVTTNLAWALLIAAALGFGLGLITPWLLRRRRGS